MEKEIIYFSDTCQDCPLAYSAECVLQCGEDLSSYYHGVRAEYNREISEQLENIENDLPF